jgi:hypothetical protein
LLKPNLIGGKHSEPAPFFIAPLDLEIAVAGNCGGWWWRWMVVAVPLTRGSTLGASHFGQLMALIP